MKLVQHLRDLIDLFRAERLLEAEGLERHLILALSLSEHPDHIVVGTMLSEPRGTARSKISAFNAALRYVQFTESVEA